MKFNKISWFLSMLALIVAIHGHFFGQQASEDSVVTWNNVAMEADRNHNARGLLMVRTLAIMHTAMFDAWAQYDTAAIPNPGASRRASGSGAHRREQARSDQLRRFWRAF
jgi:hypothetical protein